MTAIPLRKAKRSYRCLLASVLLSLGLAAGGTPASAQGNVAKVEEIRAQLFYERSGRLSQNIAPPAKFEGHNTVIGEGDAEEPAGDILVSVLLSSPAGKVLDKDELLIQATRKKDKRLVGARKFKSLQFGQDGKLAKALYLTGATCETLEILATIGRSRKTATVNFRYGE